MVILDTNVVAELMRPAPEPGVVAWLDAQENGRIWITAIGEAELRYGVALLPVGRRREALSRLVDEIVDDDFRDRVLPFERGAARLYAEIASARRRKGRPISQADAQIAAIARWHGAALATRNGRDFADCGIDLIDPWATGP